MCRGRAVVRRAHIATARGTVSHVARDGIRGAVKGRFRVIDRLI